MSQTQNKNQKRPAEELLRYTLQDATGARHVAIGRRAAEELWDRLVERYGFEGVDLLDNVELVKA